MTLTIGQIEFSVNQPYPTPVTIVQNTGGGGIWAIGHYGFVVVAWYSALETELYNSGVTRNAVQLALWEISVSSNNTDITIAWTAPNRVPDHYSIYYQVIGSHTDLDDPMIKCYETSWSIQTATIKYPNIAEGQITTSVPAGNLLMDSNALFKTGDPPDEFSIAIGDIAVNVTDGSEGAVTAVDETELANVTLTGGTENDWDKYDFYEIQRRVTFGLLPDGVILDLLIDFSPMLRDVTIPAYNGELIKKSNATNCPIQGLNITACSSSCSGADYNKLLVWFGDSIPLTLEDGDTDSLIQYYQGKISNVGHLGTASKTVINEYRLTYLVNAITVR